MGDINLYLNKCIYTYITLKLHFKIAQSKYSKNNNGTMTVFLWLPYSSNPGSVCSSSLREWKLHYLKEVFLYSLWTHRK